MGSDCECEKDACSTESCEEKCSCGTDCGGDPMECAIGMWTGSFFQAMKAVQVDILKAKMQKTWGARMEQAADAVLAAMTAEWEAQLSKGKAQGELRERLQALWQEGKKR